MFDPIQVDEWKRFSQISSDQSPMISFIMTWMRPNLTLDAGSSSSTFLEHCNNLSLGKFSFISKYANHFSLLCYSCSRQPPEYLPTWIFPASYPTPMKLEHVIYFPVNLYLIVFIMSFLFNSLSLFIMHAENHFILSSICENSTVRSIQANERSGLALKCFSQYLLIIYDYLCILRIFMSLQNKMTW